jgi:hypothetical protein
VQLRAADLSPLTVEACDRCSQHHLVIVHARWSSPPPAVGAAEREVAAYNTWGAASRWDKELTSLSP